MDSINFFHFGGLEGRLAARLPGRAGARGGCKKAARRRWEAGRTRGSSASAGPAASREATAQDPRLPSGAGRFRAARLPQTPRQASRLQPPNRTAEGASLRRALAAPGGRRWVGSPRSGRQGGRAAGGAAGGGAAALPEGGKGAI